jgi:hypothetical protein
MQFRWHLCGCSGSAVVEVRPLRIPIVDSSPLGLVLAHHHAVPEQQSRERLD